MPKVRLNVALRGEPPPPEAVSVRKPAPNHSITQPYPCAELATSTYNRVPCRVSFLRELVHISFEWRPPLQSCPLRWMQWLAGGTYALGSDFR